jgi:hypothetical protein
VFQRRPDLVERGVDLERLAEHTAAGRAEERRLDPPCAVLQVHLGDRPQRAVGIALGPDALQVVRLDVGPVCAQR